MVETRQTVGSRAQVMHGTALKTAYGKRGLMKKDLKYNKSREIVSRKASSLASKRFVGDLKKVFMRNRFDSKTAKAANRKSRAKRMK